MSSGAKNYVVRVASVFATVVSCECGGTRLDCYLYIERDEGDE